MTAPFGWASLEGVVFLISAALAWRIASPTHRPVSRSFPKSTSAQHPRYFQPSTPLGVVNPPRQA